ncbi:HAD family hydrolase [Halobacillus salinarum]|uniref:HAD family hydrolase n=1 Tax=Halobacillus salinarum TaxID=2932257 RepID=A0ABY4EPK9_9BACI|nr:HAD family hydrolase [Halobacillus salinarum]UOQ46401.1 HAD family hydrolase [Halobacillus salinarum]
MIRAIIFDLDGTLLNRDESVKVFIYRQYERLNQWLFHIPREQYIQRFIELDHHGYEWKDNVYKQLIREFSIHGINWEELLKDYVFHFKQSCVAFSNHLQVLEELKQQNLLIGMITNGKGQFQMDNIEMLQIDKYLDTILISEWEGVKKPDPVIFKRAAEKLNVYPEECVFIGDHVDNDVKASQAVGMKAVWKRNAQWGGVKGAAVIDQLEELPEIICSFDNI